MWWDLYQAIAKQGRDDCANITLNIIYLPLTMGLAMQNVIYLWWLKLYGAILLIHVSHRVAKLLDHIWQELQKKSVIVYVIVPSRTCH